MFKFDRKPNSSAAHSRAAKPALQRPVKEPPVTGISPRPLVQRKAIVSSPGDPHEREADAVADSVLRGAVPRVTQPWSANHALMRKCAECKEEEEDQPVQAKSAHAAATGAHPAAGVEAGSVARATARGGEPMSREVRDFFEARFGRDFGSVKIHTDGAAAASAEALDAHAYTIGHNIVFAQGKYSPETSDGKRLLAHELAHVEQQAAGAGAPLVQREAAADQCGPVRGIAYSYRMAIQEKRMADAAKLLASASKEDAAYLNCRLSSPGDALARFAAAQLSDTGVLVATNQLKRTLGIPETPVPGAPAKTGPPTTQEELDRFIAEIRQELTPQAAIAGGFTTQHDDDWLDYKYRPTHKHKPEQERGWSKWIVFVYTDGFQKEVNLDDIHEDKPNQFRVKKGIMRMWGEDLLRITEMSFSASMFVVSAGTALQNPMGSPWAVRSSPAMARIPSGLRGTRFEPPGASTGAANDTTVPVPAGEAPANVFVFPQGTRPVQGNLALDPFAQPKPFTTPLQEATPAPAWQPIPLPKPVAQDVPLGPPSFFQAPGSQFQAPVSVPGAVALPMVPVSEGAPLVGAQQRPDADTWKTKVNPNTGAYYGSVAEYNRVPRRGTNQICTNQELDIRAGQQFDLVQAIPPYDPKAPRSNNPDKMAKVPCTRAKLRLQAMQDILAHRQKTQLDCFHQPDPGHAQAILDAQAGVQKAQDLVNVNCAPGHPMANL